MSLCLTTPRARRTAASSDRAPWSVKCSVLERARRARLHRAGSEVGGAFNVIALTVLPTLYVLGLAVNRIRGCYRQAAGDQANLTGGIEPMFPSRPQEGSRGSP
jgi:hypothetical protein